MPVGEQADPASPAPPGGVAPAAVEGDRLGIWADHHRAVRLMNQNRALNCTTMNIMAKADYPGSRQRRFIALTA
jgi:hypothetical protein